MYTYYSAKRGFAAKHERIRSGRQRSPLVLGIGLLLITCGALAAQEDRRMTYARELLGKGGRATGVDLRVDPALGNPEAFSVAGDADGRAVISGGGPAGALYGVQQYLAGKDVAQKLSEKPDFALRGTVLFWMKWGENGYDFELTPQEFPWFYDRELLTRYLDYLFESRFNAIFLWSGFIFPSLVELPEYPDARTLSREQLLQNQEQFRWFTNECAKRNISVLMHFYNIHLTKALAQSRNVKMHYSKPDPFAAKFIHYTLLRFLTEFASVGLYVCPGEALESQYQPEWIRDVILKAAEDSKRHPWVVVRDWTLPAEPFKEKCRYDNLFTELKHNVEMIVSPVPDPRHAVWVARASQQSAASQSSNGKHIVNVHEAADVKPFRWGSPLFIHEMVKEWKKAGLDGAEVYGRVSWRWPYALDKLAPDQTTLWPAGPKLLTFERDAIWLEAFGRYLWKADRDPRSEAAWWAERLGARFGSAKAGELLRQWYDLTGPILPGVQNLTSVANMNLRPTPIAKEQDVDAILKARKSIEDDLKINEARARTSRAATEEYPSRPVDTFFLECYRKRYGLASLTNRMTMPVAEYAARLVKGQAVTDAMTPDKVVDLLVMMARESEELTRQAAAAATRNKEEIARYLSDSQAMGLIAAYYGEKINAALSKELWRLTGDDTYRANLLKHMDESVAVYRRLVELTDKTYVAATDLGAAWSWRNGLKAAEQDVARQREFVAKQREANRLGTHEDQVRTATMLVEYFKEMSEPRHPVTRKGEAFEAHRRQLREDILRCMGLWPLPERVALNPRLSEPIDHPWCTIHRVAYQLWPGVYNTGLLYLPKSMPEQPAPAVLCPHGHWPNGNAHPDVQKRCLVLAKLGYVVFSPVQNHYEDLPLGISHVTLQTWSNMRGMDYLQSLPEVDKNRIGCAGMSGGGLATEFLAALDDRVKAATIGGYTTYYRAISSPGFVHCACNHVPGVMRYADGPEICTLSLPTPLQFLTMDDWTVTFRQEGYPDVQQLYAANGHADHLQCRYWSTEHVYDQPKREATYWWMEKWLRNNRADAPPAEPEVQTIPIEKLLNLQATSPEDKGYSELSRLYQMRWQYKEPTLASASVWREYRNTMKRNLDEVLGGSRALLFESEPQSRGPSKSAASPLVKPGMLQPLHIETVNIPSEGNIILPANIIYSGDAPTGRPAIILVHGQGKDAALAEDGPESAKAMAEKGNLVVLPDLRFAGLLSLSNQDDAVIASVVIPPGLRSDPAMRNDAWFRNGVLWGRPLLGMAVTDLKAVVDFVARRPDADATPRSTRPKNIALVCRASGNFAVAGLMVAAYDRRVGSVDVDLQGKCYANKGLTPVPFILRHGDVLQWAALCADRPLCLRHVSVEAHDRSWLTGVFAMLGNPQGLRLIAN